MQNIRFASSDDLYAAREESGGATLGAKTSEPGTHFLPASSSDGSTRPLVRDGNGEDLGCREILIIDIGVQSAKRVKPAVARRQSLQWQMTMLGR